MRTLQLFALSMLSLLSMLFPACASTSTGAGAPARSPETIPPPRCVPAPARRALDAFVIQNRARQRAAITRARAFLDSLDVDPVKLRTLKIKGKKKLVEALDAYYHLWLTASPEDRVAILTRVAALARPTREDRYHDMLTLDDREFKEDATSYLRAALLLDRMGAEVTRYRQEIQSVKWRLDRHMKERGSHQRRAFHAYYQHFGMEEPFPLEGALARGLIASRADPDNLSRADVYTLTHEVYAAYDFGDQLDADPFNDGDRAYLRGALPRLIGRWQGKKDPDLVAELLACLRYTRFTGDPAYLEGISYLLDTQNPDGTWGNYESLRARYGDLVRQGFYLHTTMVGVEALLLGFEEGYRRGEGAVCP